MDKCACGSTHIDFLGHHADANGNVRLPEKFKAIQEFCVPTTIKQLRRFIGMIDFYRRFIPILNPLTTLFQRKDKSITLESKPLQVFCSAKIALANFTKLTFIENNPQARLRLTTDAPDTGVGAVVEQESNAQCKPIAFFSAKLSPTQSKYSTFSRESLATYLAIKHFRHLLEGQHFPIFTDYKLLTTAMQNSSDKYTAHELRHLDYISQFTTDLRYVKG